jgi:hypothetical protein
MPPLRWPHYLQRQVPKLLLNPPRWVWFSCAFWPWVCALAYQCIDYLMPCPFGHILRDISAVHVFCRGHRTLRAVILLHVWELADRRCIFQNAAAAPSLKFATDPAVVTKVYSYLTSLYSALSSETEYSCGPSYEAATPFREIATDSCLFTTCTTQYWSHKSSSSTDGNLWFNQATSPCCTKARGGKNRPFFYWLAKRGNFLANPTKLSSPH